MVCSRCIASVQQIFDDLKIEIATIELGQIETVQLLNKEEVEILNVDLNTVGFQILEDAAEKQIEQIKKLIILKINQLDVEEDFILSKFISSRLAKDYSLVSKSFSLHENVTLEQYFILQKIEKAKELLLYNELTLTEISQKLGYKSVQYLSTQFKNTTHVTPTFFKNLKSKNRIPLDKI